MTTIVASVKQKTMACDSRMSWGSSHFLGKKVYELEDGTLLGFCGDVISAQMFIKWFKEDKPKDNKPEFRAGGEEFAVLELNTKLVLWGGELEPIELEQDYYAIGSGADAALGAMGMGADVKKACEIACLVDRGSGPPVKAYKYSKRRAK